MKIVSKELKLQDEPSSSCSSSLPTLPPRPLLPARLDQLDLALSSFDHTELWTLRGGGGGGGGDDGGSNWGRGGRGEAAGDQYCKWKQKALDVLRQGREPSLRRHPQTPPSSPRRHSASAGSRQLANTAAKPPTYILCCFITADYGVFCVGDYQEEAEWRDPAVDPSVYNTPIQLVLLHVLCLQGKGEY